MSDDTDPKMHRRDDSFELVGRDSHGEHDRLVPRYKTDAYQGYLSALLIFLQDEYDATDKVVVTPFGPGDSAIPRDIIVTHPAASIGDSIRNLTEDLRSARIVDITSESRIGSHVPDDADETYLEIYIQPDVPEELLETKRGSA